MREESQSAKPNIFEYDDYRVYLNDLYAYFKTHFRQFSFRYFSQRAGFASPNFLKLVIEGTRNLSDDSIPRFAMALKLNQGETEFFTHLVHYNQAKTPTQRANSARLMLNTKGFQKIHPLQQAEYAYYANWYYIPVRELVSISGFREDPQWLANQLRPTITCEQAADAMRDLEALGLLCRDTEGRLLQTCRTLNTANEVSSTAIARYHRDMMGLASRSIDSVPRGNREISAACVPVSHATAQKMKTLIQNFRAEILALAGEDQQPETVYQLNMQLFPLSDWDDQGEESKK